MQFFPLRIVRELGPGETQQRAREPAGGKWRDFRHGGQSVGAGTAQQLQQHGFGLIVDMLRREQDFPRAHVARETGIARLPRRRFQPMLVDFRGRNKDALNRARNVQTFAEFFSMKRPPGRSRLQAMIHVHGAEAQRHLAAQDAQGMQQNSGIQTAAEGDF